VNKEQRFASSAVGDDLMQLIAAFEDHSLPIGEWTHEAHLMVGFHYVYHYPLETAIYYLRAGIITYNVATGGRNTIEKGYHETITQFWARLIKGFIEKEGRELPLETLCQRFLLSPLAQQEIMFTYYTKERLFSPEARALYLEPDLQRW
jgi:hypothetical protein